MPTKISHKRRIISETAVPKKQISPHDLISFRYNTSKNYDKTPLVYIIPAKDKDRKMTQKMKTHIYGINFNYLREYMVQEFFKETGIIRKSPEYVILKKFNFYKKAFRTYIIDEMVGVKLVEYKKDIEVAEFKKKLKFMKKEKPVELKNENKLQHINSQRNSFANEINRVSC